MIFKYNEGVFNNSIRTPLTDWWTVVAFVRRFLEAIGIEKWSKYDLEI